MFPKVLILVLGVSLSSLSFAQSSASIRAELKSLDQTVHSVNNLSTSSEDTKSNIMKQLVKLQLEVSNMDLSQEPCAGKFPYSLSCAGMKQDIQNRISTAIDAVKHVDIFSASLLEQALIGADTGLEGIQFHDKVRAEVETAEAIEARQVKVRDNSALSDSSIESISPSTAEDEAFGAGGAY